MPAYNAQVFLNVPFDTRYKKLFHALVFAVQDCGLVLAKKLWPRPEVES